jgi:hypothetical protein
MTSNDNVADKPVTRDDWIAYMQTFGSEACPTCGHRPQLRQHVFTVTMALAMIHLYHRGGPAPAGTIPDVVTTGESLKKLVLWGYATSRGDNYSLTKLGLEAVLKRVTVPLHAVAAHGHVLWFSEEEALIDAMLNARYSYDSLMRQDPA